MRHDLPDVYDDRSLRPPRPPRSWPWVVLLLVVAAGVGGWWYYSIETKPHPPVSRPALKAGPPENEADAFLLLRAHLGKTMKEECVALIRAGSDGKGYFFNAINRCENTRLCRFRVDRKTGVISRK